MKRFALVSMFILCVCARALPFAATVLEPAALVKPLCDQSLPTTLQPREIFTHALILSGIEPDTPIFADMTMRFDQFLTEITTPAVLQLQPELRGERILTLLHETFLKKYRKDKTLISDLLTNGSYNCVSSAVLYLAGARAAGLDAHGEGTEDHAFCSVLIDGRSYDVETTNRYGFNPGSKKEFHDSFGKTTGFAYVPVKNYARRSSMPDRAFLGLILANRSVLYCAAGDYQNGIQTAATRCDYVRKQDSDRFHAAACDELHKVCTNYAKILQRDRQYAAALTWSRTAITHRGFSYLWQECLNTAVFNAAADALNNNAPDTAAEYVNSWRDRLSFDRVAELDAMVFVGRLYRDIATMTPDEKLRYLDRISTQTNVATHPHSVNNMSEIRESSWLQKAEAVAATGNFLGAVAITDTGMRQLKPAKRLNAARAVYIKNYCTTVHNTFATLYNNKQYTDARDIVMDGLANIPNNAMLKRDLATVNKMLSAQ